MGKIAVVVPTCRPDRKQEFLESWSEQFRKHSCSVVIVNDGDPPKVEIDGVFCGTPESLIEGQYRDLIVNRNPAVRMLGFVAVKKLIPDAEVIVTLDDDLTPGGDTIGDHVAALARSVPVSWLSSTADGSPYMRGFPYWVRKERPVWVSHGVWTNIPDLDAPSQLVLGDSPEVEFYRGPVPRGVYFPFCGMNVAFRVDALPLMYWAPVARFRGAERFDDIWLGINLVRELDAAGAAMVTGQASCVHTRLSNTFKNLQMECVGIELNEHYWQAKPEGIEWFDTYDILRAKWKSMIEGMAPQHGERT